MMPCSSVQTCQHFGENYDRSLQSKAGRVISLLPCRYTRLHCVISHNVVLLTNVQVCLKAKLHSHLNLYFPCLYVTVEKDCINPGDGNSKLLETSVSICRSTRRQIPEELHFHIHYIPIRNVHISHWLLYSFFHTHQSVLGRSCVAHTVYRQSN